MVGVDAFSAVVLVEVEIPSAVKATLGTYVEFGYKSPNWPEYGQTGTKQPLAERKNEFLLWVQHT